MQQQNVNMMNKTAVSIAENTGGTKAVFYRGDTLAAYRDSSTQVATYRYDAFGNQRAGYCVISDPANAPRYTFSTKEYLSDAGLYLYQYRVYDPIAGRWTQRDPIDYQDSINLYQFCGNNPVNATDPDGKVVIPILAKWAFRLFSCKSLGDATIEGAKKRTEELERKRKEEERKFEEERQRRLKEAENQRSLDEFNASLRQFAPPPPEPAKTTYEGQQKGNGPGNMVTLEKPSKNEAPKQKRKDEA